MEDFRDRQDFQGLSPKQKEDLHDYKAIYHPPQTLTEKHGRGKVYWVCFGVLAVLLFVVGLLSYNRAPRKPSFAEPIFCPS